MKGRSVCVPNSYKLRAKTEEKLKEKKLGNKINLEDKSLSVHQPTDKQNVDYINGMLSL